MIKLQLIMQKIKMLFKKDILNTIENVLYYVCGNEALPDPLSAEEEQILLEEVANNNSQAKEKLVEHNLRLVVYVAKKFENTGVDLEDLISIGAIGLIKAVQTYKFDKNIKLATYASRCIENEILMHLRKISKLKTEVSLDEPLNTDSDGNDLLLEDILFIDDDSLSKEMDKSAEKEVLWSVLDNLNPREKEIMVLRFGLTGKNELTQKEVADLMGISQSYISRIEKKILSKLKKDLRKAL